MCSVMQQAFMTHTHRPSNGGGKQNGVGSPCQIGPGGQLPQACTSKLARHASGWRCAPALRLAGVARCAELSWRLGGVWVGGRERALITPPGTKCRVMDDSHRGRVPLDRNISAWRRSSGTRPAVIAARTLSNRPLATQHRSNAFVPATRLGARILPRELSEHFWMLFLGSHPYLVMSRQYRQGTLWREGLHLSEKSKHVGRRRFGSNRRRSPLAWTSMCQQQRLMRQSRMTRSVSLRPSSAPVGSGPQIRLHRIKWCWWGAARRALAPPKTPSTTCGLHTAMASPRLRRPSGVMALAGGFPCVAGGLPLAHAVHVLACR